MVSCGYVCGVESLRKFTVHAGACLMRIMFIEYSAQNPHFQRQNKGAPAQKLHSYRYVVVKIAARMTAAKQKERQEMQSEDHGHDCLIRSRISAI